LNARRLELKPANQWQVRSRKKGGELKTIIISERRGVHNESGNVWIYGWLSLCIPGVPRGPEV
jgi:hypothetical protein